MFKEFKEFALRGNVVDMAVGIVIGGAFGTIVKSLVDDLLDNWAVLARDKREKGVKLARFLRSELDKAERKVEILLKDEKGDIKAESFDTGDDREASADEEKDSGKGDEGDPEDIPF